MTEGHETFIGTSRDVIIRELRNKEQKRNKVIGERLTSSVLNGAVRPSWSWTAVDGVQPSRPVLSKGCPAPHGQGQFPRRSPAVRQGMK